MGIPVKESAEQIHPANSKEWRRWLQKNHEQQTAVWVIYEKMQEGKRALSWADAVDEALCFGWIDSTARTIDETRYMQFFTKRKPGSPWSKINKEKIERLGAAGKIAAAGMAVIERAKEDGSWSQMDAVEELEMPKDLIKAFRLHPGAKKYFEGLTRSVRKMMLHWIASAKLPETRARRIEEIASKAALQQKPKQF